MQVAELGEAGGPGRDGALARLDDSGLVPADRRGHGGFRYAADRVGTGDRVVAGVLVVVDEQLGRVRLLAPPGRRPRIRPAASPPRGEGNRRPPDLGEA